jgi:hypothetical protein
MDNTSGNANVLDDPDELPDFDLIEDIDLKEMAEARALASGMSDGTGTATAPTMGSPTMPGVAPSKTDIDVNDPSVVAAMRATTDASQMGAGSTRDLIRSRNRNLEQKLVVNEIVEDVPSLADYTQGKSGGSKGGMGKKAARREARRAKALDALPEEPEASALDNLLEKLPFVKKNEEKEEKSLIKLLEEGTWACIYVLVGWEIFINSPLFERQGALAPVVFTDPMTMTFLP